MHVCQLPNIVNQYDMWQYLDADMHIFKGGARIFRPPPFWIFILTDWILITAIINTFKMILLLTYKNL